MKYGYEPAAGYHGKWADDMPRSTTTRTGAVVVFDETVDKAEAEKILREIKKIGTYRVETFNPDHGWPVFYIP